MSLTIEQQLAHLDRFAIDEPINVGESRHGLMKSAGALIAAGSLLVAACGSDDSDSSTTTTVAAESTTTSTTEAEPSVVVERSNTVIVSSDSEQTVEAEVSVESDESEEESNAAVVVTDEFLQERAISCGGKYDEGVSMLDLSYKYDYSAENPEMMSSLIDITSTDIEFGMGQDAYDYVLENSFYNPVTVENTNDRTSGVEETDEFIQNIHAAVLNESHTFFNGDCRNDDSEVTMPSSDIPYITLSKGQSVEGMVIPADKLPELLKVMKNQEKFLFLEGSITDAEGIEVKTVFITLFANGCDNPIRIEVKVPKPPVETPPTTVAPPTTIAPPTTTMPPTTTVPEETTTTTTIPETTTTTTVPETTTTTVPEETTTTSTLHPPASGPPPEATIAPVDPGPTPGYPGSGNAENVDATQHGDPTNLDPTPNATETPDSMSGGQTIGGGDESVIDQPTTEEPYNPDFDPDTVAQGTDQGTNEEYDSTDAQNNTSNATSGPGDDPGFPG
jgi:hypothetical protein